MIKFSCMLMLTCVVVAAVGAQAGVQGGITTLQSTKLADQVKDVVKTPLIQTAGGQEYEFSKPVNVDETSSQDSKVTVKYQVGTVNDKPAFVTLMAEPAKLPAAEQGVKSAILQIPTEHPQFQICIGDRICVQTQIVNGREVCVKWTCKNAKP